MKLMADCPLIDNGLGSFWIRCSGCLAQSPPVAPGLGECS